MPLSTHTSKFYNPLLIINDEVIAECNRMVVLTIVVHEGYMGIGLYYEHTFEVYTDKPITVSERGTISVKGGMGHIYHQHYVKLHEETDIDEIWIYTLFGDGM